MFLLEYAKKIILVILVLIACSCNAEEWNFTVKAVDQVSVFGDLKSKTQWFRAQVRREDFQKLQIFRFGFGCSWCFDSQTPWGKRFLSFVRRASNGSLIFPSQQIRLPKQPSQFIQILQNISIMIMPKQQQQLGLKSVPVRALETIFVFEKGQKKPFRVGIANPSECNNFHKIYRKDVYKIIDVPSLDQFYGGPCGYYSIFNLRNFMEYGVAMRNSNCDYNFMLDRKKLNQFFSEKCLQISRGGKEWKGGLNGTMMKNIIKRKFPEFIRDNVMISCCNVFSWRERTIGNLDSCIKTFDNKSIKNKIIDFRGGREQYIIIGTLFGQNETEIDSVELDWDNRNNRRSCTKNHWLTMKMQWQGKPMQSPVKIFIADSDGRKENRFSALIHWYYYLFVHSRCC